MLATINFYEFLKIVSFVRTPRIQLVKNKNAVSKTESNCLLITVFTSLEILISLKMSLRRTLNTMNT